MDNNVTVHLAGGNIEIAGGIVLALLPNPLSRAELYLAKASGMEIPIPMPASREELYLSCIAGDTSVDDIPAPYSLKEQWLAYICGLEPMTPLDIEGAFHIGDQKVDVRFFAYACGLDVELPEPQNRKEEYFYTIAQGLHVRGVPKTARGVSISLADVVSGIKSLDYIYGDTTQQTYSGKNLFNYQAVVNLALAGTIVSGNTYRGYYIQSTAGETFTLSRAATTGNNRFRVCFTENEPANGVAFYNENGVQGQFIDANNRTSVSFTVPQGMNYVFIYLSNTSQTITESLHIQLETGSSATSWEKFVGGIPAPNPDYPQNVNVVTGRQVVYIVGKNLFDDNKPLENRYVDYVGKWVETSTPQYINQEYRVNGGSDITISFGSKVGDPTFRFAEFNGDTFVKRTLVTTSPVTITLDPNTDRVIFSVDKNQNYFVDLQAEFGSVATEYAVFQNGSYEIDLGSIELCKIGTYQDYIYKSGDDWYAHKETEKVILNGTEAWTLSNVTEGYTRGTFSLGFKFAIRGGYCNMFTVRTGSHGAYEYIFFQETSVDGAIYLQIETSRLSANTVEAFKDWLSLHNVTAYYTLATPTDTLITDNTLVGQLEAVGSATLPKPSANIVVAGNLAGEIEITYLAEEV